MRAIVAAAVLAWSFAAQASEEEIHQAKRVAAVADTSLFGEVEARAETAPGAKPALKSLTVVVKSTPIVFPAAAFEGLPPLALEGLQIRSERGYDKDPWLYVVFQVAAHHLPAGAQRQSVHFAISAGKARYRAVTTVDKAGASKWDKKDL